MPSIVKEMQGPLKSREYLGMVGKRKRYRDTLQGTKAFYDPGRKRWLGATAEQEDNYIAAEISRAAIRVTKDRGTHIFDRNRSKTHMIERITLFIQDSVEPFENHPILDDRNADIATLELEEVPRGFIITKTLRNARARMVITYKMFCGRGIKRTIRYKILNPEGDRDVRLRVRWEDCPARSWIGDDNVRTTLSRRRLLKDDMDSFILNDTNFKIVDRKERLVYIENLEELHEAGLQGNTLMGFYDDKPNMWVEWWTTPKTSPSEVDEEIDFDETETISPPYADGKCYGVKESSGTYYDTFLNKYYITTTQALCYWGNRHLLISGYTTEKAFCQFNITDIPRYAEIDTVNFRAYYDLALTEDSRFNTVDAGEHDLVNALSPSYAYNLLLNGPNIESRTGSWPASVPQWYTEDVNNLDRAKDSIEYELQNGGNYWVLGLRRRYEASLTTYGAFRSTEYVGGGYDPELIVEYTIPPQDGTEIGECEIGECEVA